MKQRNQNATRDRHRRIGASFGSLVFAAWLALTMAPREAQAQTQQLDLFLDGCMEDVYQVVGDNSQSLNCTANDVQLTEPSFEFPVSEEVDGCEQPGDTANIILSLDVLLTAQARYDIGMYLSLDAGDALTGSCAIGTLPYAIAPSPFTDLDSTEDNTTTVMA